MILGIARDISERKKAEEELKKEVAFRIATKDRDVVLGKPVTRMELQNAIARVKA